jgi:hypothetical protein
LPSFGWGSIPDRLSVSLGGYVDLHTGDVSPS